MFLQGANNWFTTVLNGAYVRDVECLMIGHELARYNKTDTTRSLSGGKHVTGVAAAPLAKCDGHRQKSESRFCSLRSRDNLGMIVYLLDTDTAGNACRCSSVEVRLVIKVTGWVQSPQVSC